MRVLSIDPGNKESGYAIIDENYTPIDFGKVDNYILIAELCQKIDQLCISHIVIEMIGHYGTGLAAGKTVFDTCLWIGRFIQQMVNSGIEEENISLVLRKHYVAELTGSAKAKDANIVQYLIDRFAPDTPNKGKGSKKEKGFFYGFRQDIWQAFALAVWEADKTNEPGNN